MYKSEQKKKRENRDRTRVMEVVLEHWDTVDTLVQFWNNIHIKLSFIVLISLIVVQNNMSITMAGTVLQQTNDEVDA